jgi:hypothetical protein
VHFVKTDGNVGILGRKIVLIRLVWVAYWISLASHIREKKLGQIEGGPRGGACKSIAQENLTPHSASRFTFKDLTMKFQKT